MKDRHADIETADGKMDTFITHPDGAGPYPAAILYMDAPGIREELYDFARRLGTVGYYVMVPDLYYRLGRVRFDRSTMDDAQRARMRDTRNTLSNAIVMDDTRAMLAFMEHDAAAGNGPMGCMGYCMSGRFVFTAAGTFPDVFRATASFHGVQIVTAEEDSPHLLAPKYRGEIYAGFAEDDPIVPPEEVEAVRRTLAGVEVEHLVEVHPGTEHGYSFPGSAAYVKEAAERNWERTFAMFRRQLGPGA